MIVDVFRRTALRWLLAVPIWIYLAGAVAAISYRHASDLKAEIEHRNAAQRLAFDPSGDRATWAQLVSQFQLAIAYSPKGGTEPRLVIAIPTIDPEADVRQAST